MSNQIKIIGGGLAGCEAAYQIAKKKIPVKLYEMKPIQFTPAHTNKDLAEIVCSNSFKSNSITNACGLLKQELRMLDKSQSIFYLFLFPYISLSFSILYYKIKKTTIFLVVIRYKTFQCIHLKLFELPF